MFQNSFILLHLVNNTKANPLQILHYLGLDHVGHIGGRNRYFTFYVDHLQFFQVIFDQTSFLTNFSVLMGPKLKEMDDVIKMIDLSTIQSQKEDQRRTLLVCAALSWLTGIACWLN